MLIDLTVRGPLGDRDVRLDAPADCRVGDLRAGVARAAGAPPDSPLHLGDVLLADDLPLAGSGLRCGSVVGLTPSGGSPGVGPYSLRVSGGPAAGRVQALQRGRVEVGRGAECDITLDDARISRRHLTLEVTAGGVVVLDHRSTNGSTIDGEPVPATGAPLPPGAVLQLGDSLLSVAAPAVVPASVSAHDGTVLVHRPPRPPGPGPAPVITLPAAPDRERPNPVQWVAAAVPALAAGGLAWVTGSAVFLLFGLLSPLMLLSTALGDRWQGRRSRRRAAAVFRTHLHAATAQLADALVLETEQRRTLFPDPAVLALVAGTPGRDLWARRPGDDDCLALRVGCGTVVSQTLVSDNGSQRPAGLLRSVPVLVDLRRQPIGLAGPAPVRAAVLRWWVAQLAVQHSPDDLSIVLLTEDEGWSWARWLPHVRVAADAADRAGLLAELAADVGHRLRRRRAGDEATGSSVVVVAEGIADPALSELVTRGLTAGITALWSCTEPGALPDGCAVVVARADGRATVTGSNEVGPGSPDTPVDLVADSVDPAWAERTARALAPLVDARARRIDRLPDDCTLTGLLGLGTADVEDIARTWEHDDGRADTVLGVGADAAVHLDLDRDGPHALIAGTTGSGKSELLRTVVAGLCLRHPPEQLSVLLVDYKGGAAFAECVDLPHCAGLVTDLDAHLTGRALRSLDAEIRRRELLLRAANAIDLQAYRRDRPATPLARLVIVVDEFATLADDLPDFVAGLVGVAQRGRSLGIHLVLATQRPGSVVSPEIRANTSVRIALRVTEAGESVDVVGTDDAAAISPSTPGRAVLRTGSGLRRFQTARAAITPPATATPRVHPLGSWRRPARADDHADAGLAQLVAAVAAAARATGRPAVLSPWLPPLPALVTTGSLTSATFALADLPRQQRRAPVELTLEPPSSTLLLGTARSGRTTGLASLALAAARTHSVAQAEIHLVDARGDLQELVGTLPHLATSLGPDDLELTGTLLERLGAAAPRRHLLLVDGWDVLVSVVGEESAVTLDQLLGALVRAPGAVSVAVTGDRSLAPPRFSGLFDRRLALRLGDAGDYATLGVSARALPVSFPPGRGVRVEDGVEVQIAVPEPASGTTVAAAVRTAAAAARDATTAAHDATTSPGRLIIRPLPGSIALDRVAEPAGGLLRLGVGGDAAEPITLDPFGGARRWLVSGPPRSGRSAVLAVALAEAVRVGCAVLAAAPPRSPVATLAARLGFAVAGPSDSADAVLPRSAGWSVPTLLLVDDIDTFLDTEIGDALVTLIRDTRAPVAALATGRPDDLALAYRGLGAELRRSRSGIALRPGPVDGDLFGVRLPRARPGDPPGRGWLIGDPAWRAGAAELTAPVRIQVAATALPPGSRLSPYGGSGDPCPTRTSP